MGGLMSKSVWHEGELEVQRRAGVASEADELQGMIRPGLPPQMAIFLGQRQFAVLASIDDRNRLWASVLVGASGFLRAIDQVNIEVGGGWSTSDILLENLKRHPEVGMLAIDFNNRRRIRVNGTAELSDGILRIHAEQVFSNCPKYIQARIPGELSESTSSTPKTAGELSADQRQWIARADTLFIASAHPQHGADASHRGGNPGFVHVENSRKLTLPDYSGNNLFNTLGNIQLNPKAGLLFVDFENGHTLQLTGSAKINWEESARADFPGANRLLEFEIDEVRETENGARLRFDFRTYSPFNPVLEK
jgi:predicted pyridoxine 5'-phosphate oxidase superfamily flavin-nucleotide-binding protein